jgi:hypothetical protein
MDTHGFRCRRRCKNAQDNHDESFMRQNGAPLPPDTLRIAITERKQDTEHPDKIGEKARESVGQAHGLFAVGDEREPESQDDPRAYIIRSGAHKGRRTKTSKEHSPLLQNARKDRESGNAHGDAEKEKEGNASNALRRKASSQRWREHEGKNAGNQDAHAARQRSSLLLAAEMLNIQLASN